MAEILTCPTCQRKLQVPETFFGQTVQCPECRATFTAGPASPAPPTGVQAEAPAPATAPAWQEPAAPPRRKRYEDEPDDDLDLDDRLRRPGAPHRGGSILAFGVLSVVLCGIIFGPIAWSMGSTDMAEIQAGRMDRSGEGLTQAGKVLGIVGTIKGVLEILYMCFMFGIMFTQG